MAKVLLDMAISLDGLICGPGGADGGLYDWYFDPSDISRPIADELVARALREAGAKAGVPNEASKRMVQRWESGQQTATDGYYKGARYYGAIQMLVEPTGRRMTGKWVGFGTEMDVNTWPWELGCVADSR